MSFGADDDISKEAGSSAEGVVCRFHSLFRMISCSTWMATVSYCWVGTEVEEEPTFGRPVGNGGVHDVDAPKRISEITTTTEAAARFRPSELSCVVSTIPGGVDARSGPRPNPLAAPSSEIDASDRRIGSRRVLNLPPGEEEGPVGRFAHQARRLIIQPGRRL